MQRSHENRNKNLNYLQRITSIIHSKRDFLIRVDHQVWLQWDHQQPDGGGEDEGGDTGGADMAEEGPELHQILHLPHQAGHHGNFSNIGSRFLQHKYIFGTL